MAKANTEWKVLPHEALEQLADGVWRVEGSLDNMPLKRVMTIAKRADGQLIVHNAVALEESTMKRIESFGPIGFIIVPNGFHRLDAPAFKKRYPHAKIVVPPAARKKVEEVVPVDLTFAEVPADERVELRLLASTNDAEGVMIVKSPDGTTLVVNDAVFNMPHLPGFQGFVLRHLTQSSGGPKVSRVARLFLIKDKARFRQELESFAALPGLARVVVSHHQTITSDPAGALRSVAASI